MAIAWKPGLWKACLFLLFCALLSGSDRVPRLTTSDVEILSKARDANEELYAQLKSFVCHEEIQRYRGVLDGRPARFLDTVTATLSFENGIEHYSEIYQDDHLRPSMAHLPGAWSEGEFGTLLLQTLRLLSVELPRFRGFATVDGLEAAIYRVEVSAENSPWDFQVSGRHYHLSFQTDVWISTATGEILKIARRSLDIPAETRISEVEWGITLQLVDLNGKQWLLPKTGTYSVLYSDSGREEWNNMTFSGYRRYSSEVALRFDADPAK
ncbi:MAG TPA: hypothetical protein VK604_07435 [Bryobacteraceae bacterium]|nr:hypothetical protein [Bryobacteraceae bacterium]